MILDSCELPLTIPTSYQAAKDVRASQDVLIGSFQRVETCLSVSKHMLKYPNAWYDGPDDKMVEGLGILAISTREIKQGSTSELIH